MKAGETKGAAAKKAAAAHADEAEEGFTERFEEIYEEANDLGTTLRATSKDAQAFICAQARSRPYATVGVAATAGFILAGGLSPRVGGALLTYGGRFLAGRLVRQIINAADA